MKISVVVGNPKARSRTRDAAERVAEGLGASSVSTIELVEVFDRLLTWGDPVVGGLVRDVGESDVAIFASPTYKAAYTGLLKLFLDQFATGTGLRGVVGVPLMLGGSPAHSLAPEVHLKPVLAELGAATPTRALYLLDSATQPDPAEEAWLADWTAPVRALVSAKGARL